MGRIDPIGPIGTIMWECGATRLRTALGRDPSAAALPLSYLSTIPKTGLEPGAGEHSGSLLAAADRFLVGKASSLSLFPTGWKPFPRKLAANF